MTTLSEQDLELAEKHALYAGPDAPRPEIFEDDLVFTHEGMSDFLAERDAIKHKELLAIHEVVQCIGCVKEVLPTDSVTVAGVKMMAIRLNERERERNR